MEDTEDEDIWVEFMMIDSGDTSTDDTIALSALPYILLDMSDDGDGDGDDGGSDDEFMCDNGETIPSDWVNDGYPDCEDGSDESDDGPGEEVFHYYDNCTDEGNYYECWMDEWDYDNDGDYEESHGYNYEDCSQESNGSWMCFAGYDDEEDEEEIAVYYCTPFVAQNSAGFSIFDNSSLDYSMCGMEVSDEMYEFDNSTFTMPTNLIWEDCWMEGNETVCEQGEIYYDVNTTKLWETTHENNYMDCDGDYDNNTSMCTEWIGNITDADGSAFLLVHDYGQLLMIYQYDEVTQSGLVISVDSEDGDMDPEMLFNMFDANEDGEVNASEWADFGNQSEEGLTEDDWNGILMMIEMFDEDNSSGLNLNEFTNMMESMEDEDDMSNEMMFNMFDANDDGEVNASEWADAANQSGEGMTEDDFNGLVMMVEMYDEDNSSGLNFDEFVNMMESMEDDDDDNDGWSFDRELQDCDSDDDAMVSYTELEACINEDLINDGFDYLNASMVGADYAFNMTDMDADGMLNESEFYELNEMLSDSSDGDDDDMDPETMFNMLDGNGDGEVTTSEWSDFSNSTDEPMSEESFEFLSGVMDNYDDDDSGGLDFDEFMTFMDEMEDMEDGDGEDMKMYMVFGVLPFGADVEDLTVDLVMCIGESLEDMQCDDPVHSRALIDIMVSSEEEAMMAMMTEPIVFVDSDESGTLTTGDFVMINNATLDVDLEWNFARLYSSEAGAYSDENPMMSMLPGFTGFIATIGLLGAALIRRE